MGANVPVLEEERRSIIKDFHSDLGLKVLAKKYKRDAHRTIARIWKEEFTKQEYKDRTSRLCSLNQLGSKNTMFGKLKEDHPRSVGSRVVTTQGYHAVYTPTWYEGKSNLGRTLEHILVYCKDRSITKLPNRHVVHHIDNDRKNNASNNLVMLSIGDHLRLHNVGVKKVQRLSERSRTQESSKRNPSITG